MAYIEHEDSPVGALSAHPPGYVQAGDPGAVGAYKVWVDTSGGTGLWVEKIRNAANAGWEVIGGGGGGAATQITETGGPATLTIGAIADGEYGKRVGATFAGGTPSGGEDAAATLVQTIGPSTIASGGTLTLGAAPADGNVILLCAFSNQFLVTSITQTNVTWTKLLDSNYLAGNYAVGSVWKGVVAASAGTVITINFSGSNANGQHVYALEYSGSDTPDIWSGNAGPTTQTRSVALATWKNGGTFVAFCGSRATAPVLNPTTRWTLFSGMPHDTGFTTQLSAGYNDPTANAGFCDVTGPTDNSALILVHLGAA